VERGCGLDVGQKTVAACMRLPRPGGGRQEIIQTFGTMTADPPHRCQSATPNARAPTKQ